MTFSIDLFGPFREREEERYNLADAKSAEECAEACGCTVEYSNPRMLQLDIDTDEDFDFFQKQFQRLLQYSTKMAHQYQVRPSKSGNRHVTIELLEDHSVIERIMLQAFLGSDRTRELLNYGRHLLGAENPIRLFRPDDERRQAAEIQEMIETFPPLEWS